MLVKRTVWLLYQKRIYIISPEGLISLLKTEPHKSFAEEPVMSIVAQPAAAIEMAAKYICNFHCGRCPMMVVSFSCPSECNLDTVAWQCWIYYFQSLADKGGNAAQQGVSSPRGDSPANSA